jgi:hypothetical protein
MADTIKTEGEMGAAALAAQNQLSPGSQFLEHYRSERAFDGVRALPEHRRRAMRAMVERIGPTVPASEPEQPEARACDFS